ncbi:MAG: hypothetical protein RSD70_02820 [Acidaminococcaceae bacterium]
MNTLTEKQTLRYDLLKANSYDVKNAKACYEFVADNEQTQQANNGLTDGIYLMQDGGGAVLFTGQAINENEKSRCVGIGVKLASKSLVVSLREATDEDTELTTKAGGSRFITQYHEAVEDWAGKENTADMREILRDNIKLEDGEYIPSLGQMYFILLHFRAINAAIEAVGGETLRDDWYWTSTECSATYAWYLYLNDGTAGNTTKAAYQRRVRPVSAFLL